MFSNFPFLQTALVAGYGLLCFGFGWLVCKYGISTLIKDVENLKVQSPITVSTPTAVAPVAN